ncbi:hypothetical protein KKC44_02450 [Patescibacteria group bacterium]|nr:hypothetical protein [Patescibacteria group bacterium]MBU2259445.1 hypothetical protein [Patescibacteria group bacterium]
MTSPEEMQRGAGDPQVAEDGERYGYKKAWSRELGISMRTMQERLAGVERIPGETSRGHLLLFYSEADVRKTCSDLLLPQADESGYIRFEGSERYTTVCNWSKRTRISRPTLRRGLDRIGIKGRDGKNASGVAIPSGFFLSQY